LLLEKRKRYAIIGNVFVYRLLTIFREWNGAEVK
jgi:hypothetical protein